MINNLLCLHYGGQCRQCQITPLFVCYLLLSLFFQLTSTVLHNNSSTYSITLSLITPSGPVHCAFLFKLLLRSPYVSCLLVQTHGHLPCTRISTLISTQTSHPTAPTYRDLLQPLLLSRCRVFEVHSLPKYTIWFTLSFGEFLKRLVLRREKIIHFRMNILVIKFTNFVWLSLTSFLPLRLERFLHKRRARVRTPWRDSVIETSGVNRAARSVSPRSRL